MPRPTASSLWLAELCPASHVLPQIRETSEAQAVGTAVHRFLERCPQIGKQEALAELDDEARELCQDLDSAELPHGLCEATVVYDIWARTGQMIGEGLGRKYPDGPGIACGTVDVLQLRDRIVWDYKTGWPGPAAESIQLQALGLYSARAYDWMRVTVGHLRISGERLRPDMAELGPVALAAAHERVASIYEQYERNLQTGEADIRPGEHCTNCSAQPQCPATMALTSRTSAAAWANPDSALPEDISSPAAAYAFLVRVEDLTKRLRSELKRQAAAAPIPLPNGKELAIVEVEKTKISAAAMPILREAIGQERLDSCCSVSKAALARTTGAGVSRLLLRKLAEAGALTEKTERQLREVKASERTKGK